MKSFEHVIENTVCPRCGASKGEPCIRAGRITDDIPHSSRVSAYWEKKNKELQN